jgi:hypothetical protein
MCHFNCNVFTLPETRIQEYDYVLNLDDEGGFIKPSPFDPIERIAGRQEEMGALICGQRLREGSPHQGHLDCRIGLWEFTKNFLEKEGLKPKSPLLQKLLEDENAEWNFHFLPWVDSYVFKTKMFKSDLWKKWITAVNEHGGIFKYRWGDNEIYSLFYLIYDSNPIYNKKIVEGGYYDQGLFRGIQNIAPGVKK